MYPNSIYFVKYSLYRYIGHTVDASWLHGPLGLRIETGQVAIGNSRLPVKCALLSKLP